MEQLIYVEELERAHAPYVGVNFVGLLHAGPTVIVEGTPDQRARYLPPILRGDEMWCQGFSEPDAGSDLASLRTGRSATATSTWSTARRSGPRTPRWPTYCELLVRTGPEDCRHRGITWLILPMDRPGIDVRPLRTIAGSTEFAELFLDGVRVPVANRVGDENDGWRVAMTTLASSAAPPSSARCSSPWSCCGGCATWPGAPVRGTRPRSAAGWAISAPSSTPCGP